MDFLNTIFSKIATKKSAKKAKKRRKKHRPGPKHKSKSTIAPEKVRKVLKLEKIAQNQITEEVLYPKKVVFGSKNEFFRRRAADMRR